MGRLAADPEVIRIGNCSGFYPARRRRRGGGGLPPGPPPRRPRWVGQAKAFLVAPMICPIRVRRPASSTLAGTGRLGSDSMV